MLANCEEIGRRAREAAARGDTTFAIPEAAPAARWVTEVAPDPALRAAAEAWAASAGYHELLRLCRDAVLALDDGWRASGASYRAKVNGELEAMLTLWPDVLVVPTPQPLSPMALVELRAFPVHPLGLVAEPAWTDGAPAPPSEFFFHDLDHARFKVREDQRAAGIEIPDAYQDGTTIDPATGRHRIFLAFAQGRIGDRLWQRAAARTALVRRLRAGIAALGAGPLCEAAELLLFEVIHEKSFALEADVLARELGHDAHLAKLHSKVARGFFPTPIDRAVLGVLPAARAALLELLS
jgi:hypothetical protein